MIIEYLMFFCIYFWQMLHDFVHLLYPNLCSACFRPLYKNEYCLCSFCKWHLPKTNFHREKENPLMKIFWGRIPLISAQAYYYFNKGSKVQRLVHQLKYKGKHEIGYYLGQLYGKEMLETSKIEAIDYITPVPLHPDKLAIRGYNQAELIASGMSVAMDIPLVNTLLKRLKPTASQTRKSRYNRWENVCEQFMINADSVYENKHLLLVDDVITTGATIDACAKSLLETSGIKISVASLAAVIK